MYQEEVKTQVNGQTASDFIRNAEVCEMQPENFEIFYNGHLLDLSDCGDLIVRDCYDVVFLKIKTKKDLKLLSDMIELREKQMDKNFI